MNYFRPTSQERSDVLMVLNEFRSGNLDPTSEYLFMHRSAEGRIWFNETGGPNSVRILNLQPGDVGEDGTTDTYIEKHKKWIDDHESFWMIAVPEALNNQNFEVIL